MDRVIVKEEPLDLDDQGEDGDGMYSESEDEGIVLKKIEDHGARFFLPS